MPGVGRALQTLGVGDVDFMLCAQSSLLIGHQDFLWLGPLSLPAASSPDHARKGTGGRIMAPQDVHIFLPGACEYVILHGKEESRLQGINVTNQKMLNRKGVMDYPGGASLITRSLQMDQVEEGHRQGPLWKNGWREATLLALKMKEGCCELQNVGASF